MKKKKKVLLTLTNGRVITEAKDGIHIGPELLEKESSVETIDLPPNWVGMFDAAIANARSNKDNLSVEMLDFGKRLYIQSTQLGLHIKSK